MSRPRSPHAQALKPLEFELLERRLLFSATPTVAVDAPDQAFISEEFDYSVSFDNTGSNTAVPPADNSVGYGPFADVKLGAGLDGSPVGSYLGTPVNPTASFTNDDAVANPTQAPINFVHPLTGETISLGFN